MTHAEFAKGWRLLVLQPWGWRYNQLKDGKPTAEAQAQLEFYFDALKWAHPDAWWKVATLYAQGTEWPSVNELRGSLRHLNAQFVTAIGHEKRGEPMPDDVRERLARLMSSKSM